MSAFKVYNMWWQQSLSDQTFYYSKWKKTSHQFKARSEEEAKKKMNGILRYARITGRFLCVEDGYEVIQIEGQDPKVSPIEQILKSALEIK